METRKKSICQPTAKRYIMGLLPLTVPIIIEPFCIDFPIYYNYEVIVFAYICGIYSSREIEAACHHDIRFMWILNGEPVPDHSTIASFQNEQLTGVIEELFYATLPSDKIFIFRMTVLHIYVMASNRTVPFITY